MDDQDDHKGEPTPPRHWFQRPDFMKYFAKEKPWVKLCALGMLMFPASVWAVASALTAVWRLIH